MIVSSLRLNGLAVFFFWLDLIFAFWCHQWVSPCLLFSFIVVRGLVIEERASYHTMWVILALLFLQNWFLVGNNIFSFIWLIPFYIVTTRAYLLLGLKKLLLYVGLLSVGILFQGLNTGQWGIAFSAISRLF